jgi:hypothetical protein
MSKEKNKLDFDEVYEYILGMDCSYPSFKILYNSKDVAAANDYQKIQLCLIDFLVGLRKLTCKKEKTEELKCLIDSVFSRGVKKFIDRDCTMIESRHNLVEDRHVFYKVKVSPRFILELEEYKPVRLDEMTPSKSGLVSFFKDETLNKIIEQSKFNPDYISIFSLRQTEYGVGDMIFQRMFEEIKGKLKAERLECTLRAIKKKN